MDLSPDFYNVSAIYVPRGSNSPAADFIAKGAAIIGAFSDRQPDPKRILVYYEGNIYGSANLKMFSERCDCAHGRMAQRYPTMAMSSFEDDVLTLVGYWHPREKNVELGNENALAAWNGWQTPIDRSELGFSRIY